MSQEITGLDLMLVTRVKVASEDGDYFTNHVIDQWRITDIGIIEPGEVRTIPFEARLHSETPITEINAGYNQSYVWLETGLDIDLAFDQQIKTIYTFILMKRLKPVCKQWRS